MGRTRGPRDPDRGHAALGARRSPSIGPDDGPIVNGAAFATAAYSSGLYRAGLFIEHAELARTTKACDEVCELEDHVRRRSSAGLFVSRTWD